MQTVRNKLSSPNSRNARLGNYLDLDASRDGQQVCASGGTERPVGGTNLPVRLNKAPRKVSK